MSESVTIADIYQLFRTSAEEFDRRLRESDRRIEQAKLESDRRIEQAKLESDRTIAELKRTVEQTNRAVNSLTTRWGRFVEELVQPAVLRLFQEKGIDIKEIYPRARVKRQGIG
ncbi:MAG: DUF3782 domain-containing protein, partial [Microcystis sp. M113S1]|uniref:DUF3782 domain-containing protein n=1 Tax=Microcystis sp. M113S1 TaxID=2771104 RepID=UPI002584A7EF